MIQLLNRILYTFCLILAGLTFVNARPSSERDSLELARIYQTTVNIMYTDGVVNTDSLLYYAEKGIDLARKYDIPEFIPDFITNLAYGHKRAGKLEAAMEYGQKAYHEALSMNAVKGIARSGYTLAILHFDKGDVKPCLLQISRNLQFATQHKLNRYLFLNYHLLAHINSYGNNPLVTDYYTEKAYSFQEDTAALHIFKIRTRLKNAIIEKEKENEEKLYIMFWDLVMKDRSALDISDINLLMEIADTYRATGNPKRALEIYSDLSRVNLTGIPYPESAVYAGMAAGYLDLNQLQKAETMNRKANRDISLLYGYNYYLLILRNNAIIKEKKGRIRDALNTWKEIARIEDSLLHKRNEINYLLVSNLKNLESLEGKFESVNYENAIQRQLLEKEKRQKILLLSLVLILIIFSLAVYALFRKLKVRNQKILEQNEAISRQTESLRESNLVKDKLFSLLSHELRSPVAELITLLDVNEWKNKDSALNPYFKSVNLKAKAIYNTLDNILTWSASQLKFQKTEVRAMNLRETAHKALELSLPYIQQKNIRITNEVSDALIEANESYLMIIFRNVLNNATKFTPAGGEIRLYSVEEEDYSGLVVQDSGTGINPETLQSLFVNPQTSSEGTEGEKGSGVGLMLCKDLMDKLQGKVEVSSTVNQGTSVKLLFKKEGRFL